MKRLKLILVVALLLYVGSYLALSRAGYRHADEYNVKGFYFCTPDSQINAIAHETAGIVYSPLIVLDVGLGTGRWPAKQPLVTFGK